MVPDVDDGVRGLRDDQVLGDFDVYDWPAVAHFGFVVDDVELVAI